jgi:hypothetical protein
VLISERVETGAAGMMTEVNRRKDKKIHPDV